MIRFELIAFRKFINTYFYRKNNPMKVLSLKELMQCKMLVIFLLKRIDMIIDLELETKEMKEHPQNYEPKEKYQNMLHCVRNKLKNIKFQCITLNSNKVLKKN